MKRILKFSAFIFLLLGLLTGCKKDAEDLPVINLIPELSLKFSVDNNLLQFDTLKYINAAGNNYSVSRLQFYLSAFEFENAEGLIYKFSDVIYVDATANTDSMFSFATLPLGNYKRLKFLIGLDSIHNVENALPNTIENDNMVWPSIMGGGYHFMKLEGNFIDMAQPFGYAMHLGRNQYCVTVNCIKDFTVNNESAKINLTMNINEWFQNPQVYDFNVDGNYSMGDTLAMAKLSQNGVDVFKLN